MIEYKINTPSKLSKVKSIWKRFLTDDNTWHFTLEGDYIELRINIDRKSAQWVHNFENYLRLKKWGYTKFPYTDNIPITRKYQKQFEKIFHGYSVMAMTLPRKTWAEKSVVESDFTTVTERCVHLFYNMCGVDIMQEAYHLAQVLVGRAYTAGWYSASYSQRNGENGGKS